jgi:hypothetical protein
LMMLRNACKNTQNEKLTHKAEAPV